MITDEEWWAPASRRRKLCLYGVEWGGQKTVEATVLKYWSSTPTPGRTVTSRYGRWCVDPIPRAHQWMDQGGAADGCGQCREPVSHRWTPPHLAVHYRESCLKLKGHAPVHYREESCEKNCSSAAHVKPTALLYLSYEPDGVPQLQTLQNATPWHLSKELFVLTFFQVNWGGLRVYLSKLIHIFSLTPNIFSKI